MTDDSILEAQWYWDRRNKKAYFPREQADGTVEFVTMWHVEEVEDALEGNALVPLSDIGVDKSDTTFTLIESFRTLSHLETSTNSNNSDSNPGAYE